MAQHIFHDEDDICKFYHIHDKKLGEGGFAKVRLATHLATKQCVAVKVLDKMKLASELPRVYNEIKCLKKLRHKNIARLYQVFETPTVIYLVLEYCCGGELFDYIVKKTRLDESEAAQIVYDLMKVLDFIHINGFAHRDLKPENVLFDEKHQIKLIDFGLAANCSPDNMAVNKDQAPIGQLSTCCGSITYAAPEVISGELYSGTAVDVWSAGVMMYASVVGQLPFNDNSISKLYQKIQAGILSLPPYLTPDACDLLRKMLTVDPKHRITVRDVLTHPWLRNRTINISRITRRLDYNSCELDDQVIKKVNAIFPHLTEARLRDFVKLDFNYYSTAYHLLHAKCPPRSMAVKRPPDFLNNNSVPSNDVRISKPPNIQQRPQKHPATPTIKYYQLQESPNKKARFLTVSNTPKTPRTPPSYLRRLHESTNTTPKTAQSKLSLAAMSKFKPTPRKSLVKRLLASATPKKLRRRKPKQELYL